MTEKFLDKRCNIHYSGRFSRSECINGFLKDDNGVLELIGTTERSKQRNPTKKHHLQHYKIN